MKSLKLMGDSSGEGAAPNGGSYCQPLTSNQQDGTILCIIMICFTSLSRINDGFLDVPEIPEDGYIPM